MTIEKIKTVAIHQPNFLPWIGFFYKWLQSDIFVLLDTVQFTKGGYINRVKIKSSSGENWMTIPVEKKGKFGQEIFEVHVSNMVGLKEKLLGNIQGAYAKTSFFKDYFPSLKELISKDHTLLVDYNLDLLKWVANILKIKIPVLKASELSDIEGAGTNRLVSICKAVGGRKYLSGFGGNKYQNEKAFQNNNIELITYNFHHPIYSQLWGEFVPGLSVIDFLFNCGHMAAEILRQNRAY